MKKETIKTKEKFRANIWLVTLADGNQDAAFVHSEKKLDARIEGSFSEIWLADQIIYIINHTC